MNWSLEATSDSWIVRKEARIDLNSAGALCFPLTYGADDDQESFIEVSLRPMA